MPRRDRISRPSADRCARQERQHAVDAVAHFLRRHVAVLFEQERDDDLRHAFGRVRPQFVDAADRVDGLFDLVGDLGLDSSGAAPGSRVVTTTVGKSTFGKRSSPSLVNAKAPMTVSESVITVRRLDDERR